MLGEDVKGYDAMSMESLILFIQTYGAAFWHYLALTAPFLFLGLIFGGIIYIWIPLSRIQAWLGQESLGSVVRAAFFGVPLPLCSCSVIPTSLGLRRAGASKAATSSFVISTPESGVDSIAVTYAVMDLPMTIIRPVAAFFSAVLGGVLQIFFNKTTTEISPVEQSEVQKASESSHNHMQAQTDLGDDKKLSFVEKTKAALRYGFGDLLDDMAGWFLFGLLIGASLEVFLPSGVFEQTGPLVTRFVFIFVGIPLYLCASASTPIAAALVLKGVSPGAALILLLVGPATSIPNMLVLKKVLGVRGVFLNVFSVALVALIFSFIVDFAYGYMSWPISFRAAQEHGSAGILEHGMGALLLLLLLWSIGRSYFKGGGHSHSHSDSSGGGDCC